MLYGRPEKAQASSPSIRHPTTGKLLNAITEKQTKAQILQTLAEDTGKALKELVQSN